MTMWVFKKLTDVILNTKSGQGFSHCRSTQWIQLQGPFDEQKPFWEEQRTREAQNWRGKKKGLQRKLVQVTPDLTK